MSCSKNRSQRLEVKDLKIWDSTQIYDSGRISVAADKGMITKAHYLSTPGIRLGRGLWKLGPDDPQV
jgi:hypothetical protein